MSLDNKRKNTYGYRVYGLNIQSEIILNELIPIIDSEYTVDVTISYGKILEQKELNTESGIDFKSNLRDISYVIEGIAGYYVSSGNTIIVEPCDNTDMEMLKIFLLGYTFGILLFQRNNIAIHGGTIVIGDRGVIFTGDSGAGKSTLTTTLREKGYLFMNDDTSVVSIDNDRIPVVYPGYPQQKLCKDVLIRRGYKIDDYKLIDKEREKYAVPVHNNFLEKTLPLAAIFEITQGDNSKVQIEKILGIEKLRVLQKNIYGISIANQCGVSGEYYKKSLQIAQSVAIFRIKRPKNKFTVEEQIAKIEGILKSMDLDI